MVRYTTAVPLYRHASDTQCCDCGRACAQMIISSLVFGALPGIVPSRPVPIRQDQLKALEANPTDTPGNWFTFPDELHTLLVTDPSLVAAGLTDWRLANVRTPVELFAWASKSVRAGKPAVINIRAADHWVCVRSVIYDTNGVLTLIECLDPLLQAPQNPPGPNDHTYQDRCNIEVEWAVIKQPPGELGTWEVEVGSTPPATYQHRCVGIMYGPGPLSTADVAKIDASAQMYQYKKPGPPDPEERVRELLRELARDIPEITDILQETNVITPHIVRDLAHRERPYTIAAAFVPHLERGFVAIFDQEVNTFFRIRLTSNKKLTDSITKVETGAPLWWQRRGLSTLYSAYFPYLEIADQGATKFRRLIDDQEFAPGDHPPFERLGKS
jgi:hypothetical protein